MPFFLINFQLDMDGRWAPTAGCVHACHSNAANLIAQHTSTCNFGKARGCAIDIYFHCSCVKLSHWFSWRKWLRPVGQPWKSTSPRTIFLWEGPLRWPHVGNLIKATITEFHGKRMIFLEKYVTNKCTADVMKRIESHTFFCLAQINNNAHGSAS